MSLKASYTLAELLQIIEDAKAISAKREIKPDVWVFSIQQFRDYWGKEGVSKDIQDRWLLYIERFDGKAVNFKPGEQWGMADGEAQLLSKHWCIKQS